MPRFAGQIALVTGAARAPGSAIAQRLADEGARLALLDLNPDGLTETATRARASGGDVRTLIADVAQKRDIQTAIYSLLEDDVWGQIDILINATAVAPAGSLLGLDEYDFDRTLAVNLKGAFLTTQTVARAMAALRGGVIVNVVAPPPTPPTNSPSVAVAASLAGLTGLTRAAATELEPHRIRVNAITTHTAPGLTTLPGNIADGAVYLCGHDVTGGVFVAADSLAL